MCQSGICGCGGGGGAFGNQLMYDRAQLENMSISQMGMRLLRQHGIENQSILKTHMNITGKEYLVVNGAGNVLQATKDLVVAKKVAGEQAHSSQGTVYIFQPVLEIAPKRDVVETSITLG